MFLVGLTGGIAAGKSTVAEYWQSLGAEIIDADVLAREVVEPGSAGLKQIVSAFGEAVLNLDGSLNRSALADVIFSSTQKRSVLESITHPLIRLAAEKRLSESHSNIVVYVIPLLFESKSDLPFDLVVTVEAPEKDQAERLMSSRKMTLIEAMARITAQAKPAQRANIADRILSSNQSLSLLMKHARFLWGEIEKLASEKGLRDDR